MILAMTTLVILIVVIKFFVVNTGVVNGVSMEPTFIDDDRFLVSKFTYLLKKPQRYDIVQVIDPASGKLLIKRIIGLPGEVVMMKRGKVFIGDDELPEPYLSQWVSTHVPEQKAPKQFTVGADEYFVLGDNRSHSTDSRFYGPVHRSRIVGAVVGKL